MYISFERSGGFAGMRMIITIDSASLVDEDATHLHKLVEDADFFNLQDIHSAHGGSDGFHYTISIQSEDRQRTLQVSDGTAPEQLQPLLQDLSLRARSQRRPG